MAEYDSIVFTYHIFIHGPVGSFHVLAIVNSAAVTMGVLVPTRIMVFFTMKKAEHQSIDTFELQC